RRDRARQLRSGPARDDNRSDRGTQSGVSRNASSSVLSRAPAEATPPAVHVDAIRKAYGATVAVDDVSFVVQPGEIFGLIGPNGAGKTTTMECIEGLRTP